MDVPLQVLYKPIIGPFFGFMGSAAALSFACEFSFFFFFCFGLIFSFPLIISFVFSFFFFLFLAGMGAAYGTAKAGVGVSAMGVQNPGLVMKSIIPVVMAGVLGIYGLIVSVIIASNSVFFFDLLCFGFFVPQKAQKPRTVTKL